MTSGNKMIAFRLDPESHRTLDFILSRNGQDYSSYVRSALNLAMRSELERLASSLGASDKMRDLTVAVIDGEAA